jgi:hypothetical protein
MKNRDERINFNVGVVAGFRFCSGIFHIENGEGAIPILIYWDRELGARYLMYFAWKDGTVQSIYWCQVCFKLPSPTSVPSFSLSLLVSYIQPPLLFLLIFIPPQSYLLY